MIPPAVPAPDRMVDARVLARVALIFNLEDDVRLSEESVLFVVAWILSLDDDERVVGLSDLDRSPEMLGKPWLARDDREREFNVFDKEPDSFRVAVEDRE